MTSIWQFDTTFRVVHVLDEYGIYTETEWLGQDIWEINKTIAKTLHERGVVWKIDYIRHEYPHNPRTGNRLIYRAHPSWFMDIDGQRSQMLIENTEHINWFPDHIKHGRFGKTIETAPDWNLSRDRFWATAMPVWKGTDKTGKEHIKVIGSYAELKELSGVELEDYHRPWVDDITFESMALNTTESTKLWTAGLKVAACHSLNSIIRLRMSINLNETFRAISLSNTSGKLEPGSITSML